MAPRSAAAGVKAPGLHAVHVAFQPIVDSVRRRILGYEALVRSSEGRPGAEGLVRGAMTRRTLVQLDRLVRVLSVRNRRALRGRFLFLNVSPQPEIDFDAMARGYARWLAARGIHPGSVVFELSERMPILQGPGMLCAQALRAAGFKIALDDVGTGTSGLSAVVAIKPDFLKIDRSITAPVATDPWARAVVSGIEAIASVVQIQVIAEGVETEDQLERLIELGVRYVQGYHVGRPERVPQPDPDVPEEVAHGTGVTAGNEAPAP